MSHNIVRTPVHRVDSPIRDLRDSLFFPFQNHFDKIFQDFFQEFSSVGGLDVTSGYPKLDALTTKDSFIIKAAVPGVQEKDISIELNDNILRLSGEMSSEYKQEEEDLYVKELHKSRFSRTIELPENIEGDPEAVLKDGLLTLKWKIKPQESPKTKKIAIKSEKSEPKT